MSKTFKFAGILQGIDQRPKTKYTNDLIKRYYKFGDLKKYSRVDFVEFDTQETKSVLLEKLLKHEKFQSVDDQLLISDELDKQQTKLKKHEIKVVLKTGTSIVNNDLVPA